MIGRTNAVVGSSGGGGTAGEFMCTVIDYDGTVLKQEFLNTGDTFELPSVPDRTSEGLVFDGWSSPVDIVNNSVTVEDQDINIGAMYYTSSGKIETEIQVNDNQTLTLLSNITGEKDWGDGTVDTEIAHTYTNGGKYLLKISNTKYTYPISGFFTPKADNAVILNIHFPLSVTDISYSDVGCVNLQYVTTHSKMYNFMRGFKYCYSLKVCIISTSTTYSNDLTEFGSDAFASCYKLEYVVFPNRKLKFKYSSTFSSTYNLKSISFPKKSVEFTNYATNTFSYCISLTHFKISSNFVFSGSNSGNNMLNNCLNLKKVVVDNTKIPNGIVSSCYKLEEVELNNIETMGSSAFNSCYNLTEVVFPSTLSTSGSIQSYAFTLCCNILTYDFSHCVGVIPLSNTNAFSNLNPLAKILVPASLEAEWKAATNWSTYASQIVGV